MKKDIHPTYGDATIARACGNVMGVRGGRMFGIEALEEGT